MFIKKISISNFGKLSDFEMTPSKGLNIIYAPNESGKTTLLSFIKYIFYGTKQKKRHGDISFKEKYTPWNSLGIGGSFEIQTDKNTFIIQRTDADRMSKLSVINALTGEEIKDIKNPGLFFTGVGERAFSDSCFITDILSVIDGSSDGELVSVLSDMCDQKTTYSNIKQELNERLAQIVSPKRLASELNVIEKNITDMREKLQYAKNKIKELEIKILNIDETEKRINDLKLQNNRLNKIKNKLRYDELTSNIISLSKEKEELEDKLLKIMNSSYSQNDLPQISNLKYLKTKTLFLSLFIITLFIAAASFYNKLFIFLLPLPLGFLLYTFFKTTKNITNINNEHYDENKNLIIKQIEYLNLSIDKHTTEINNLGDMSDLDTSYINSFTNHDIDDIIFNNEKLLVDLSHSVSRDLHFKNEISLLELDVKSYENEINRLNDEKKSTLEYADVIETAVSILDTVFMDAKTTFLPELSKKTFDIFESITKDNCNSVVTDENFDMSFYKDGFIRNAKFLSKGTLDILYFSLRIAIIDIMSENGSGVPIFLDDVFSNCDDERTYKILDLISEMSKTRQIFLCTCRGREGEYFINNSDVNIFRIQKG